MCITSIYYLQCRFYMPILGNFSSFWALQACWQRELFYPKITMRPYPPFASIYPINLIWMQSFCHLLNSNCKHNKSEILPFSLFDSDPCCRIFQRFRRFHSRPCPFDHNQCLKRREAWLKKLAGWGIENQYSAQKHLIGSICQILFYRHYGTYCELCCFGTDN